MICIPCPRYRIFIQVFQPKSSILQRFQYSKRSPQMGKTFRPRGFSVLHRSCTTQDPPLKRVRFHLLLYRRAVCCLQASSFILAFSRNSSDKSSSVFIHSSLIFRSCNCLCKVASPTSVGNMASVPYVRLYGVSPVEDCEVHR